VTTHAGFAATSSASSTMPEPSGTRQATPSVAVVICAYTERRWPELTVAVASALGQQPRPDELILVIDHDDALYERAKAAFGEATVTCNTGPRGLSGARNTGIARARADVVAFLDDDAEAQPGWLAGLLRHYRDPAVLAVGGRAEPVFERARPRWLPPEFDWVVGCSYTGQPPTPAPVRNLIGCNMSFRRAALDRTGGFDPALGRVGKVPVGCEETELCIRLRRRHPGGIVRYDPAVAVRHKVTAERGTWLYFRRRCLSEGRSKAVVTRLVGTEAGLSAEREYIRRTLPVGVWRGLRESWRGDTGGLLRAAVLVAGLGMTATGYLAARLQGVTRLQGVARTGAGEPRPVRGRGSPARQPASPAASGRKRADPEPVRVLAIELADAVPALDDTRPGGGRYGAAEVLVRLHGEPIGLLRTPLPDGGLSQAEVARLIGERLSGAVEEHLRRDGLAAPNQLPADRLAAPNPLPVDRLGGTDRCPALTAPVDTPFVSVVVPTAGRVAVLRPTLRALAGLDYPHYEIIVVDNAPHRAGTAELLAELAAEDPRLRCVPEPTAGVAYARNRGLAEARGEIVAFVDDDVIVDRRCLRAIVGGFADEAVAAVTGHVLAGELETPAQLWIEQFGSFGKGWSRRRFDATGYETVECGRVRRVPAARDPLYPYLPGGYGSGANMAFRTQVLRRLGGFDPLLGSAGPVRAGEDIDVLLRLVLAGHSLVYEPRAVVWHAHKREMRDLRPTIYRYGVGLSAVMAKQLVTDRAGRRALLRRLPRGVLFALAPGSEKNSRKRPGYPASLTALEVCGMALGPAQYARAAWSARSSTRGRVRPW
jgi:GT2 family glycosyltransferase